jgi:hypothetical protein
VPLVDGALQRRSPIVLPTHGARQLDESGTKVTAGLAGPDLVFEVPERAIDRPQLGELVFEDRRAQPDAVARAQEAIELLAEADSPLGRTCMTLLDLEDRESVCQFPDADANRDAPHGASLRSARRAPSAADTWPTTSCQPLPSARRNSRAPG